MHHDAGVNRAFDLVRRADIPLNHQNWFAGPPRDPVVRPGLNGRSDRGSDRGGSLGVKRGLTRSAAVAEDRAHSLDDACDVTLELGFGRVAVDPGLKDKYFLSLLPSIVPAERSTGTAFGLFLF